MNYYHHKLFTKQINYTYGIAIITLRLMYTQCVWIKCTLKMHDFPMTTPVIFFPWQIPVLSGLWIFQQK